MSDQIHCSECSAAFGQLHAPGCSCYGFRMSVGPTARTKKTIMACQHGKDFRDFCPICDVTPGRGITMGLTVDEATAGLGGERESQCVHGVTERPGIRCTACLMLEREQATHPEGCFCTICVEHKLDQFARNPITPDNAQAAFEHYKRSAAPFTPERRPGAVDPAFGAYKAEPQGRLPSGSAERKGIPIATGCLDYFPDALAEIARLSRIGNDKHNPGQPLHWSRGKSNDHPDCMIRHFFQRGTMDTSGAEPVLHSVEMAWRALAIAQLEIEERRQDAEPKASWVEKVVAVATLYDADAERIEKALHDYKPTPFD